MSDSDGEGRTPVAHKQRQNRFRFKTFAERVNEVDVDVYRSVQKVRVEPSHGATSFLQEGLSRWRELNSAADWLRVAAELNDITQTLPQILHHEEQIIDTLLGAITSRATSSLPPLFDLVAVAARDLQQEYVQLLPRVTARFTEFLSSGGDRDPDALQSLFTSLSLICKVLAKHLCAQLPTVLKLTTGLRYSRANHVRCLAAESLGYLFRHATDKQLRAGTRALLAEHAIRPTPAREHGAGLLIAESVLSVSHGLHSRAPSVLALLLQDGLLQPEEFAKKGSHKSAKGLTADVLSARVTAVAAVALDRILGHLRRGKGSEVWAALLSATHQRYEAYNAAVAAATLAAATTCSSSSPMLWQNNQNTGAVRVDGIDNVIFARAALARVLTLLTQAVNYFRGSRVEDFTPLFELCEKLVSCRGLMDGEGVDTSNAVAANLQCVQQMEAPGAMNGGAELSGPKVKRIKLTDAKDYAAVDHHQPQPQQEMQPQQDMQQQQQQQQEDQSAGVMSTTEDLVQVSLSSVVLRLLLAIIHAHTKVVGASQGLSAISKAAPSWCRVFATAPNAHLLHFIRGLIHHPGGANVAEIFAPQMLGALGRMVMAGGKHADSALLLLLDACEVLRPSAGVRAGVPLVLTAQPKGVQIASHLRGLVTDWQASSPRDRLVSCWVSLQLAPHTCESHLQAVQMCDTVIATAEEAVASGTQAVADILQLHATAIHMLAQLLPRANASQLAATAATAFDWCLKYPDHYATVNATASLLSALTEHATAATAILSASKLAAALPALIPNLTNPSQMLRGATLTLLTCFDQPQYTSGQSNNSQAESQTGLTAGQPAAFSGMRCEILDVLGDIHCQACSLEHGRKWSVALGRIANHLEYRRVPVEIVPSVVAALMGVQFMRFSPLWSASCEALAMAVATHPDITWPLVRQQLITTQAAFLTGQGRGCSGKATANDAAATADVSTASEAAAHDADMDQNLDSRWHSEICKGSVAAGGGFTDASNRLGLLLKALTKVPSSVMEKVSGDWVPLFLEYIPAKRSDGEDADVADDDDEEADVADGNHGDADVAGDKDADADVAGTVDAADLAKDATAEVAGHPSSDGVATESHGDVAAPVDTDQHRPQQQQLSGCKRAGSGSAVAAVSKHKGPASQAKGAAASGSSSTVVGGLLWRAQLQSWLTFLAGIKGAKGLHRAGEVQQAIAAQLTSIDPAVQSAALRGLKPFKLKYMPGPLLERLLRLADNKTLREELTLFPLAPGAEGGVRDEHRPGLTPLLISVLFPKLRKRSGRLGGKGASGSARSAILNFLAALQPMELRPLLELFLEPISHVFVKPDGAGGDAAAVASQLMISSSKKPSASITALAADLDRHRLIAPPWWSAHLGSQPLDWWLNTVDQVKLAAQPARRKIGFLNAFEDMLQHLGYRLQPLLPPLLAITIRLLQEACQPLQPTASAAAQHPITDTAAATTSSNLGMEYHGVSCDAPDGLERSREVRSQCLRLFAQVWSRFSAGMDYNPLWPEFLPAVAPLMPRIAVEAVAEHEPPLLACAVALAASPGLARVLGNLPSLVNMPVDPDDITSTSDTPMPDVVNSQLTGGSSLTSVDQPSWAKQGLGGQLVSSCIAVLRVRGCSEASRAVALGMIEQLLEGDPELLQAVLLPWAEQLLMDLKSLVVNVLSAPKRPAPGKNRKGKPQRRANVVQELTIMERLGGHVHHAATASQLAEALVSMLQLGGALMTNSKGQRKGVLDEMSAARALGALAALWSKTADGLSQQSGASNPFSQSQLHSYCQTLSMLAGRLTRRDSRMALAGALSALGRVMPPLNAPAGVLCDLNSWSTGTLDEPDYDRRLAGYSSLVPEAWRGFWQDRPGQGLGQTDSADQGSEQGNGQGFGYLPSLALLLHCFFDLRNGEDLALRQAAEQALSRCVDALVQVDTELQQQQAMKQTQQPRATASAEGQSDNPTQASGVGDPLRLIPRVLYPHCKSQLGHPNLAVRQEHLSLLRKLVIAFPRCFPDLTLLTSADAELDFFLNVAHLQVHRRGRALHRLTKLIDSLRGISGMQGEIPSNRDTEVSSIDTDTSPALEFMNTTASTAAVHQETVNGTAAAGVRSGDINTTSSSASVRVLVDVATPLLQQFILEGGGGDNARAHDRKQADVDREANVTDAAISALGAVARHLAWPQYSQLLNQWIRHMAGKPGKAVIRAVCAILDSFHFSLPDQLLVEIKARQTAKEQEELLQQQGMADKEAGLEDEETQGAVEAEESESESDDAGAGAGAGDDNRRTKKHKTNDTSTDVTHALQQPQQHTPAAAAAASAPVTGQVNDDVMMTDQLADHESSMKEAADIQRVLLRRILPALHKQLVLEEEEVVRAPVAIAMVKLLKLLPAEAERIELPRALQAVANLLRQRLQRVRDDARTVLVAMSIELGPPYVIYICNVLRAALPDRGFTAHVIGYTVTAVLEALVAAGGVTPGDLDGAIEHVLPLLEADLFGQVAEAKEVSAFAGSYKEAKRCRAYECYQLLATSITFSTCIRPLLSLVTDRLVLASSPTIRNKLTQLLQHAARGVMANQSATAADLGLFVHETMEGCLTWEEEARVKVKAAVGAAVSVTDAAVPTPEDKAAAHEYLMMEFVLTLLNNAIKKGVLIGRDPSTLGYLDPLLPLLVRALACRQSATVGLALKLLSGLVGLPLPGLAVAASSAGKAVTVLLKRVPDLSHPVAQDCFRLLSGMLRDCPAYQPTTSQLRFLLKWIGSDLDNAAAERQAALTLLRAVLGRKLVVPEVYDVMNKVQELMIKSHGPPVRATCAAALLTFLLDYPLGANRLQQHLQFLMTNIGYEHETGRLQALEMVQQVIMKFPPEVVANFTDVLYLPLVARLVNENSPKCTTAVAATLKLLFEVLNTQQNDTLAGYCRRWLHGSSGPMRRAAAQALGLLADVERAKFSRRVGVEFIADMDALLQEATQAAAGSSTTQDADVAEGSSSIPQWQEAYHVLVLLEKLVNGGIVGSLSWDVGVKVQGLWERVIRLLLHPHLWVRKASARLLGLAFSHKSISQGLFERTTRPGELALLCYQQLEADGIDDAACLQAVKCLVTLAVKLAEQQQALGALGGADGVNAAGQHGREDKGPSQNGTFAAVVSDPGTVGDDEQQQQQLDEDDANQNDTGDDGPDNEDPANDGAHYTNGAANGAGVGNTDTDEDEGEHAGDDSSPGDDKLRAITLRGLILRMSQLAEDARYPRQQQRMSALRWIAAAASAVGPAALLPHLHVLVRPLYRIVEAGSAAAATAATTNGTSTTPAGTEDVRNLGEEVLAHLRGTFGPDALLAAYNAAREHVKSARAERKKAAALKVMLDPEAAARQRTKRTARKAAGRAKKLDEEKKRRSARGSGGFSSMRRGGRGGGRGRGRGVSKRHKQ